MLNSKTQINKRSAGARKILPKPLVDSFAPSRPWNLSHLDVPTFLMCPPISYSTKVPNNIWMEDLTESKRKVEPKKAYRQFQTLYQFLSSRGVGQLLPVPPDCVLQDLVFTANLGILLEHLPAKDTVVLANYQSTPRVGETEVGVKFLQSMGYKTIVPKTKFEGEAELKHLYDNVYVGGYGIRSEKETYDQLENQFGMKIIKVRERDSYLYHLSSPNLQPSPTYHLNNFSLIQYSSSHHNQPSFYYLFCHLICPRHNSYAHLILSKYL